MIRILVVDDHQLFRAGICQILAKQPDMIVVAEAGNGTEAIAALQSIECNIVLLDLTMPGMGGLEFLRTIRQHRAQVCTLVLSMHPEDQYARRVISAGASGYLTKESAADELVVAIRRVASGKTYVSASLAETLVSSLHSQDETPPHQLLSEQEFLVMTHLVAGMKLVDIANILFLSEKTITTYRARVLKKMNLRSNAELVHYAVVHKLID